MRVRVEGNDCAASINMPLSRMATVFGRSEGSCDKSGFTNAYCKETPALLKQNAGNYRVWIHCCLGSVMK